MSDRPIEEVIGWTKPFERMLGMYWIRPDSIPATHATVDDLAAWLDAELGDALWSIQRGLCGHLVYWDAGVREGQTAEFPTIREALIAAVRKVAAT